MWTKSDASKSPQVTPVMTRQVAHLARLALTDQEANGFSVQLGEILKYVEQLQEVDVTGVEPMMHPFELATPMRDDTVVLFPRGPEGEPKILEGAPDVLNGGYKVPPIL